MSMSETKADAALNADYTGAATPFLLLHTGSPGIAGTANVAQFDDGGGPDPIVLKAVSFAAVSSHATLERREVVSDAGVAWAGTEIDSGQEITHYSIWDGSDGPGTDACVEIGAVAESKTTGSDGVTIASGDISVGYEVFLAT